ncbi:MAG: response regulator [Bacteroidetes bacterium]|nr:response regulator [Bacteroidota bacterium]
MTNIPCKYKIFLADDNKIFALFLMNFLKNSGFTDVHSFETGELLLQRIHEKPDIVLLDYFLNSKVETAANGNEILKQVIELYPDTYVIMVTSIGESDKVRELFKCGASDYITKDEKVRSNLETALIRVRAILDGRSRNC